MCDINTGDYERPDLTNDPAHCWNMIRHEKIRRLTKAQVLSAFRYMSCKALRVRGVRRDDLNSIIWQENEDARASLAAKAQQKESK